MCCSVNVSVCFVCCVLDSVCELFGETIRIVNCLLKQFAMCVGVVAILLLNVMDVFSVCGVHGFIVIAWLQFLPHMNRSYVYNIIFWLCYVSVLNFIPDRRSSKTFMCTVMFFKV